MITIELPFDSPPLRSNQRLHWARKASITREIRSTAKMLGSWRCPVRGPVVVSIIWTVPDKRRRDVGASSPTLKAIIDGLVDGKMLARDDHDVVTEERCRIEYVKGKAGVRVEILGVEG